MYVLPVVSSTTKAHTPRLAASKLTRFILVLTFTCQGDQSSGHHPVRRGGGQPQVPYITGFLHGLLIWGELLTFPGGTRMDH